MGRHAARRSCPFCGWHCTDMKNMPSNRRGQRGIRPQPLLYWVQCCSCGGGRGPEGNSPEMAAASWDGRKPRADRHGNVVQLRLVK
jgi:hypothetical protein